MDEVSIREMDFGLTETTAIRYIRVGTSRRKTKTISRFGVQAAPYRELDASCFLPVICSLPRGLACATLITKQWANRQELLEQLVY
jgi:hypothetical protein